MSGSFVSSAILVGADALIRAHGVNPAELAPRAGVPVSALNDPDMMVPARSVLRLFELAAAACDDPSWGLRLAYSVRLATVIGPLWILLRNARTVAQMCTDFAHNFDLYTSAARVTFEPVPGGGLLNWMATLGQTESEVQMAEFAMATCCNEIRTHCPPGWMPRAVLFRHAAPADLNLHRRLFGHDLRFDQDRNALLLDDTTLAQPLRGSATHVRTLVRAVLRHEETALDSELPAQVEIIIRRLLPFAPCTIGNVSLAMGIAPRTLQAHLQQHGQSFKNIKDAVRAELALKYLLHSGMSIGQIADCLDYGDITAFSRSFRRWHGRSARDMRAQSDARHEAPSLTTR